jgi:hypothetical protein
MQREQLSTRTALAKFYFPAVSGQMHCKQFEYMHYVSKIIFLRQGPPGRRIAIKLNTYFALAGLISLQRLPTRCVASNLSSNTELARSVLSSGFRSTASTSSTCSALASATPLQRLSGRGTTNDLCTCAALARFVPFGSSLASASQRYRAHDLRRQV